MKKPVDTDARAPTFTVVTDLATGKVLRVETVLADGSPRVLYPLTPEQIEEFERELTVPRHKLDGGLTLGVGSDATSTRSSL